MSRRKDAARRPDTVSIPEYLRLADALGEEIYGGAFQSGERLPPERALCEKWKVSRGTVQKALALLVERGLVVCRRGSGTFVAGGGVSEQEAVAALRRELMRLRDLQFGGAELDALFFAEIWNRLREEEKARCAFVSDMPELLEAETQEIAAKSGLRVEGLLLDDVVRKPSLLKEYGIWAARDSCYPALTRLDALRQMTGTLEEVVFALSLDTIRALVSLEGLTSIAVAYTSRPYLKMLGDILGEFCPGVSLRPYRNQEWRKVVSWRDETCLLLPPVGEAEARRWTAGWDGRVIGFSSSLDRGSSARLMERGRRLWEEKRG